MERHRDLLSRRGGANGTSKAPTNRKVRLTCQMCRQRKVKCDKRSPCTNCSRCGIDCEVVERPRLPRGKTQAPTLARALEVQPDLQDRVKKLESIIRHLTEKEDAGGVTVARTVGSNLASTTYSDPSSCILENEQLNDNLTTETAAVLRKSTAEQFANKNDNGSEKYIGTSFWADLSNQISDRLSTPDSRTVAGDRLSCADEAYDRFHVNIYALSKRPLLLREPAEVPLNIHKELFRIYLRQVDPLMKIVHTPSIAAHILDGKPYLHFPRGHPAPVALVRAISYVAICSLSGEQSLELFALNRDSLIEKCQHETDEALKIADYLVTNEVTVLQALVFFLVSTRAHDCSRRAWTLFSMALRIAQAISLHITDPPFPMRPFEREMRRRLWNMIGLLDIQGCLDRACEPMMQGNWIRIHPPSNINDDDLSPDTSVFRPSPDGTFTDMTFSLMLFNAQCTVRSLNFSDWAEPGVRGFKRRQEIVTSFHEETSKLLKQCPINGSPLQWYTKEVSDFIYASLQLIAVRPLQRDPMFTPPLVPNDVLLKLAVEVLERSHRLYQDPRGTSFRWFGNLFVPWHPLAVAIAESCVCSDHLLMSRVWPLIEQSYRSFKSLVADAPDGMLWKPMTRFMDRARNHQARLSETSNVLAQSQIPETLSNVAGSSSNTFSSIQWPTQTQPNQSANVEVRQETDAVPVDQSMPVNTVSLWPDMWYPGELDGITLGATDEAWMNYESFMANMYDYVDSNFMMG